jgi:hypothetical protein
VSRRPAGWFSRIPAFAAAAGRGPVSVAPVKIAGIALTLASTTLAAAAAG